MRIAGKMRMDLSDRRNNHPREEPGNDPARPQCAEDQSTASAPARFAALRGPLLAHRVISLLRSNLLAPGVKRISITEPDLCVHAFRHPVPCRPDTRRRVLHGVGFPTIHRLAVPGHAAFYRASSDALGRRDRSRLALRDACVDQDGEFADQPSRAKPAE